MTSLRQLVKLAVINSSYDSITFSIEPDRRTWGFFPILKIVVLFNKPIAS
jgi:hypothetical protein